LLDYTRYNDINGIEQKLFRAGEDKARIGFDGQLRECDSVELQAELNETYSEFKDSVLAHRRIDPAYLQGKTYSGSKALELGFIDGFADSIYDFLDLLKNGGVR